MTAISLPTLPQTAQGTIASRKTFWLTILILATFLPRIGFLARPFESDAGLYIYMGKAIVTGQTLYHDFYETKLPGTPLLTAGVYTLFGHTWWPYVALQIGMVAFAAWLLAAGARRHLGQSAFLPTLLFSLVFLNFSPAAYRGFQLETVQTFFACIAAHYALKALAKESNSSFQVGLFAGLAAMVKPTAAAVAGAYAVALLIQRRGAGKSLVMLTLGALIAPLLVFLYTWQAGLLPDMPALFKEISLYGSQTPLIRDDLFKLLGLLVIAGFPFLATWIFRRQREPAQPSTTQSAFIPFALTWLILECLGVYIQRRMYAYHFLPIAAPLALLFGQAMHRIPRPAALIAALAPILLLSVIHSRENLTTLAKGQVQNLPESDYLLARAAPTDTVVGDAIERVLMETRLRCGSRYAHLFYFANHDAAPLEYGQRFLQDLQTNKPTWAIFETDRAAHHQQQTIDLPMYAQRPVRAQNMLAAWRDIDAFLAQHYTPVASINRITIYRLKASLPPG